MAMLSGLVLLLAASVPPLPAELEYRLSLARALPAPYSGAVITALIPSAKLQPEQVTPLAEEAYRLAGRNAAVAARAWLTYRDNYDKDQDPALDFPYRTATPRASCVDLDIDDPQDYYRWALIAGPRYFRLASNNARSAVDVGRIAEAVLELGGPEQRVILSQLLNRTSGSDREFIEAIRYTALHNSILKMGDPQVLLSYRTFLITNLAGRRCAGNRAEEFFNLFKEFNQVARRLDVPLLTPDLAKVRSVEPVTGTVKPGIFALEFKLLEAPLDDTSVTSMLTEINKLLLEQTPGTSNLNEEAKNYLYYRFSQRLLDSPFQDRVVAEWLRFLASSNLRESNPRVWFRAARSLSAWAWKNTTRQYKIESAGDPALTAYVRLTALLPESEVARVLP